MKEKIAFWALPVLITTIFAVSFTAFGVRLTYFWYPGLLSLLLTAGYFLLQQIRKGRKHRALSECRELPDDLLARLSEYDGRIDRDYREIIGQLHRENDRLRYLALKQEAERREYYTVWVHQIKTPIASMRLRLSAEDSKLSRSLGADLFEIEEYVEMVLTYQRLQSASGDYVFREYELDRILKEQIRKFAASFIDKGISLSYRPTRQTAVTDAKWIGFVIGQLLSNALKYTPSGRVEVAVIEPAEIVIQDTGVGILPEDLPRIFERGYTGFNGRNESRSSGLGLFLCKQICDKLGCRIWVESEPGKGTRVHVDLRKDPTVCE